MFHQIHKIRFIFGAFLLSALSISCNKNDTTSGEADADTSHYVIESALTTVGQMAYSAEAEEALIMNYSDSDFYKNKTNVFAACSYATARSSCSNSQTTVDWNGCAMSHTTAAGESTATLKGVITETFSGSGAATCQLTGNADNVKRVISSTNPLVLTLSSGATLTRDLDPGTAYDGTTFATATEGTSITKILGAVSNGLTCNSCFTSNGDEAASCRFAGRCYQIVMNGLHTTFKGPKGRTWYEHIQNSDVTFTGSRSAGNRVMAGTVTVWHELAKYKAVNTFNTVTWSDSTCCYPTSGSIDTTLTGSLSGTMTMVFSTTCGQVTVTNNDDAPSTVNLTQCSE